MSDTARIQPLEAPYPEPAAAYLARSMPAWSKMEPIVLFRTWARHMPMVDGLAGLGRYILANGSLEERDREVVIHRTTARLGAEYEWGVHAVGFAQRVGFDADQLRASVSGRADDPAWTDRDRLLVRLVDELVDTATVGEELWTELAAEWSDEQLLELLMVAGFYHAVSFTVNALGLAREPWAASFADVGSKRTAGSR